MEQKHNNSKKRQAILDMLRATTAHPSAETVYTALKPDFPELSLGTVYRNLQILEKDGLVRMVCTVDGQARYDARVESHVHCYCTGCRRVMDVDSTDMEKFFSTLCYESGFEPVHYSVTVSGLCRNCRSE